MNEQADMLPVSQLIYWERHWRDTGQWENMRSAYHPESLVRVAWFQGTGFEFVEASKSLHRVGQSKHRLSPTLIRLNDDRALAETDAVIETRTLLRGIEVDTSAHCRLFSRVRRDDGIWRLAGLDIIYEKDMLAPVNPSDQLLINREELQRYRPSYRFLCYNLHSIGREVDPSLPGDDRPELVAALYAEAEDWLMKKR
ncbi:MAG TPA: nuclear transport factor 2 family protein [Ktedonobacteraceae bacterium]|nr:nuclear transport factor 2 family protein [Ktedonobacteraceae bacterium]